MTKKKRTSKGITRNRHPQHLLSAACALGLGAVLFAAPQTAHAQAGGGGGGTPIGGGGANSYQGGPVNRGPVERVADGKVVNKADAAIPGAVVYLKDSKSLAVKTFIADDSGHFHFGQLGQNTDYELWAESNGTRSKSKAISSFDSKNSYNFTLKIDAAK